VGVHSRRQLTDVEKSDIYKIVQLIMTRGLNPVIIFAFSKRECEHLAMQMSKLDFNTEDEGATVGQVFENAIGALSEDDRKLPQIELILPLLKRGIGIHHGGLLPILKEVIEILFQEGLIKVLFATETFSIGLNMPAKTVVFTSVRKFDGKDFRNLSGGVSSTLCRLSSNLIFLGIHPDVRSSWSTRSRCSRNCDYDVRREDRAGLCEGYGQRAGGSLGFCFPLGVQHDHQSHASRRSQSRIHAGALLFPVPEHSECAGTGRRLVLSIPAYQRTDSARSEESRD